MDREVLLVRYGTLAANRRHFENLFFAVVAFSWFFALALSTVIIAFAQTAAGLALIAGGAILVGGAFIGRRLMLRERSAFDAMTSTWRDIIGSQPPEERTGLQLGAMTLAASGQGLVGLICVVLGAVGLL